MVTGGRICQNGFGAFSAPSKFAEGVDLDIYCRIMRPIQCI